MILLWTSNSIRGTLWKQTGTYQRARTAMSSEVSSISVTALQLERSILPWVILDTDAEVLACIPDGDPQWIPSRSLAKSDLCLQEVPVSPNLPKVLNLDSITVGAEKTNGLLGSHSMDIQPEFAALVGMACATYIPRLSKKNLDEDQLIILRECFPDMSIAKQLQLIVYPALQQAGLSIASVTERIHQKLPTAGIALASDAQGRNPISMFRGFTGWNLFRRLMGMESPIPEALLYGVLLKGTSMQHGQNGKAFLTISGIKPEYYRMVLQLFWQMETCPAPACPRSNLLMRIYQHDIAASFATDEFTDLSASLSRFRHVLLSQSANNRRQFVKYEGQTYALHRIKEIRLGELASSYANQSHTKDCQFEAIIRNGRFLEGGDVSSLQASTKDHRNRKSKEREQHQMGTFVPKRSMDRPSKYYERIPRENATGEVGKKHSRALFDGDCQLLTPYASVLAKDVSAGDTLLNGMGQPVTVRAVIREEVDEDFCDALTHHMGHLLVAQDAQVKILGNVARGFTKKDLSPTGRNAHLRIGYPRPMEEATWVPSADISERAWIPIPKPRDNIMALSALPTFDLAEFIDARDTVSKIGKVRFTITPDEVIWHCYKSFKAREYDGIRIGDVQDATGLSRTSLRQMAHDTVAGHDVSEMDGYACMMKYLDKFNLKIDDWAKIVKSPVDIAMPRILTVSEDFAYLIGFYLADGTAANGCVGFALDKSKPEEEACIRKAMKSCFPYASGRIQSYDEGRGYFLNYSNPVLESLFKHIISQRLYEKAIPDWMFGMPDSLALALLKGLINGDGSTKNSRLSYAGASYRLVYQVRHLLMRFGTPARCSYSHIRSVRGNMSVVLMLDAPLTDVIRNLFDIPTSKVRQTIADEEDGYLIARYQKSTMYHKKGTAYSFVLNGADDIATAAGIVQLAN